MSDEGEEEFLPRKYLVAVAAIAFLLVVAAVWAVSSQKPVAEATPSPVVMASASPVAPSASPSPIQGFSFSNSYSAPVSQGSVSAAHSIESNYDGYVDEFTVGNYGDDTLVVDVVDAVPSGLGNASDTFFSDEGFVNNTLLSVKPFVRVGRAVLASGKTASRTTTVNRAVANASEAAGVLHVVAPPLSVGEKEALAPVLAKAVESNLPATAAAIVSRALADSIVSGSSLAEGLENTRQLIDDLVNPPQELVPRVFFDPQAFLRVLPEEISLDASEAVPSVSYNLPLVYSTPFGVPLLCMEGELQRFSRVESVRRNSNYYTTLFVELTNAPKDENELFSFESMEGELIVSLAASGFAERRIPVTVSIRHLTLEDYEPTGGPIISEEEELRYEEELGDGELQETVAGENGGEEPSSLPVQESRPACSTGRVGAMGDSITAARSPNYLDRLHDRCPGMLFQGYGVRGQGTDAMKRRFASDIVSHHYDDVIILGGVNNIGGSVDRVKADLQAMYDAAHEAGIRVIAVTVTPWKGWQTGSGGIDWNQERQQKTDELNAWILSRPRNVDVAVDAYSVLEDPNNPDALRPEHTGDHLHPNAAGHRMLGDAIYAAAYRGSVSAVVASTDSDDSSWAWPAEGVMAGYFVYNTRTNPTGHTGLDISNSRGSPVTAAFAGTVIRADNEPDVPQCVQWYVDCGKHSETSSSTACGNRPKPRECDMCGKNVVILDAEDRHHLYCHLSEVMVRNGDRVVPCQKIGEMGATGNSRYANHLHYSVYQGSRRNRDLINPMQFLNPSDPSIRPVYSLQGEARHCNGVILDSPAH